MFQCDFVSPRAGIRCQLKDNDKSHLLWGGFHMAWDEKDTPIMKMVNR